MAYARPNVWKTTCHHCGRDIDIPTLHASDLKRQEELGLDQDEDFQNRFWDEIRREQLRNPEGEVCDIEPDDHVRIYCLFCYEAHLQYEHSEA